MSWYELASAHHSLCLLHEFSPNNDLSLEDLPLKDNIQFNLNLCNTLKIGGGVQKIPNTFNVVKSKEHLNIHVLQHAILEASSTNWGAPAGSVSGRGSSHLSLMVFLAEQLRV